MDNTSQHASLYSYEALARNTPKTQTHFTASFETIFHRTCPWQLEYTQLEPVTDREKSITFQRLAEYSFDCQKMTAIMKPLQ